jgi:O-antigen ligase
LAITLLWVVQIFLKKEINLKFSPLKYPLLGLLAVAVLQLMIPIAGRNSLTYDAFATRDAAIKLLVLILFFVLFCSFVNTDQRRQTVVNVVIVMASVIALIGIGQSYLGKVIWPRANAGYGPFVNRNHFAGFCVMAVGLAGARVLLRTVQRERMALHICYLIIMCSGIVLCASRGGFLALVGVIFFLAMISVGGRKDVESGKERSLKMRFAATAILLVVMAVGAMFITSSDDLMQRFANIQAETEVGETPDMKFSRSELWQNTSKMIKDHPILGVGLGAYQFVYPRYDQSSGILRAEQAHNDYLHIIAETGVIGLILTISFIVILFGKGFALMQTKNKRRSAVILGSLAGCFGIAIHSFVDFNLQVTNNAQLFLALAALATTMPLSEDEEAHEEYKEYTRIDQGHQNLLR